MYLPTYILCIYDLYVCMFVLYGAVGVSRPLRSFSLCLSSLKQPLAPGFWFWVLYMHSTYLLGTYVCMIERSCGSYLRLRGSNQLIYVLVQYGKIKTEYVLY